MKVLMITPYVTLLERPEFSRNQTGFGYMVMDIARSVGELERVEVLTSDTRGVGFSYNGVIFLKRSLVQYFLLLFKCVSPLIPYKLWRKYRMSKGSLIRIIYYWAMTGYLRKIIKNGNYDIVHIHGCSFAAELWMDVCKYSNQKYVVTLHGLTSFSDTVRLEAAGKNHERDFLSRVAVGEFPITVISSGMKRIIEETYKVNSCPNVYVVCNSFSVNNVGTKKVNIRELYSLPKDSLIILYVGNVCHRKNQGQFINAFKLLPEELANRVCVLFLGGNTDENYNITKLSKGNPYQSHFIACGVVEKDLIGQYYEQGDAVALISRSEGFGLSLIEGMHFGLPCLSFSDMDAFEDIYDESAMVGVHDHSDEMVARGIELLLTNIWDREKIKDYSKKFEIESMAQNYQNVYKQIL